MKLTKFEVKYILYDAGGHCASGGWVTTTMDAISSLQVRQLLNAQYNHDGIRLQIAYIKPAKQ